MTTLGSDVTIVYREHHGPVYTKHLTIIFECIVLEWYIRHINKTHETYKQVVSGLDRFFFFLQYLIGLKDAVKTISDIFFLF